MNMAVISLDKSLKAIKQFTFKGTPVGCAPYGNGHINDTFIVTCREDFKTYKYIMQRVNTDVFPDIEAIVSNVSLVTAFLKKSATEKRAVLDVIPTRNGKFLYRDEDDLCWRAEAFIDNSICLERPESNKDFYECGIAFGDFVKRLDDFPVEAIKETIKDFHNTEKRYRKFLSAVAKNKVGRASSVEAEIAFINERADFYSLFRTEYEAGNLPLRVTHNDTKCNNVMLDKETRKALCVIDLDTIMPGFSVNDFGDSIRFGANTADEDEKDIIKVKLDIELFKAFAEGFIKGSGGLLKKTEVMLLPEGAKMMTIECGMRFLTDYLQGDTYFKTSYPEHNLVRCRTQLKLVEEMEKNWDTLKEIVSKY